MPEGKQHLKQNFMAYGLLWIWLSFFERECKFVNECVSETTCLPLKSFSTTTFLCFKLCVENLLPVITTKPPRRVTILK